MCRSVAPIVRSRHHGATELDGSFAARQELHRRAVKAGIDEDGASSTGKLGNKVLLEEDGLLGKRGSGSASVRVAQQ